MHGQYNLEKVIIQKEPFRKHNKDNSEITVTEINWNNRQSEYCFNHHVQKVFLESIDNITTVELR